MRNSAVSILIGLMLLGVCGNSWAGDLLAPPQKYNTGSLPRSLCSGDFNDDGIKDIATANWYSNSISILLGNGDGSFQPNVDYASGAFPISIAKGDFNNDGRIDLAVVNYGNWSGGTVSIFIGNGDGSFTLTGGIWSGYLHTLDIAAGDFNRDGHEDLAIANIGNISGNTVSILSGNGDGTFQPPIYYSTGVDPIAVITGDFNADGWLDLAAVNNTSETVSILMNTNGTFSRQVEYPAGAQPMDITGGDFNRDGILDIAITNSISDGTVSVLLGKGKGKFHRYRSYPAGTAPVHLTTGDFNRDGILDIGVVGNGIVALLIGDGSDSFVKDVYNTGWYGQEGIVAEDFNRDGKIDLAVGAWMSATDSVSGVLILGNVGGVCP